VGPDPPFTKHLPGPVYLLLPKRISAGKVEPTKKPYDLVVFGCTGWGTQKSPGVGNLWVEGVETIESTTYLNYWDVDLRTKS